jgi:two-component system, OmpR family, phosphate regulon response regulator PhoB
MSHILIVEDEAAIAELLAVNLRHGGHDVTIAPDAAQAQVEVDAQLPDLVLLDWMLPGGRSGLQLARAWRDAERTRGLPIIMLTARADEQDKLSGLDAADDYVTKPFSTKELLARVRTVLRRRAPQTLDEPVSVGGLALDPAARRITCDGREVRMGPTEFKLLHFLMTHPERVHTRAQLLDRVWGDHVFIEERTVDVHIKRLRDALETTGRAAMVETVRGAGYRFARQWSAPGAVAHPTTATKPTNATTTT